MYRYNQNYSGQIEYDDKSNWILNKYTDDRGLNNQLGGAGEDLNWVNIKNIYPYNTYFIKKMIMIIEIK